MWRGGRHGRQRCCCGFSRCPDHWRQRCAHRQAWGPRCGIFFQHRAACTTPNLQKRYQILFGYMMIHNGTWWYMQCTFNVLEISWEQQWATCTDSRTTDPFQLLEVESSAAERCFQELCALNFPKALTMSSDAQLEQCFCFFAWPFCVPVCVCVRLCFFCEALRPSWNEFRCSSSYPSKGCSQVALDRPNTVDMDPGIWSRVRWWNIEGTQDWWLSGSRWREYYGTLTFL